MPDKKKKPQALGDELVRAKRIATDQATVIQDLTERLKRTDASATLRWRSGRRKSSTSRSGLWMP